MLEKQDKGGVIGDGRVYESTPINDPTDESFLNFYSVQLHLIRATFYTKITAEGNGPSAECPPLYSSNTTIRLYRTRKERVPAYLQKGLVTLGKTVLMLHLVK